MNGTAVETVASSWIEALGGVSMCWILRIPPDFWAHPGLAVTTMPAAKAAKSNHPVRIFMLFPPMRRARPARRRLLYALPPKLIRTESTGTVAGRQALGNTPRRSLRLARLGQPEGVEETRGGALGRRIVLGGDQQAIEPILDDVGAHHDKRPAGILDVEGIAVPALQGDGLVSHILELRAGKGLFRLATAEVVRHLLGVALGEPAGFVIDVVEVEHLAIALGRPGHALTGMSLLLFGGLGLGGRRRHLQPEPEVAPDHGLPVRGLGPREGWCGKKSKNDETTRHAGGTRSLRPDQSQARPVRETPSSTPCNSLGCTQPPSGSVAGSDPRGV